MYIYKMDERKRNWFITINNYSEEEKAFALSYDAVYILVAEEIGEQEHTPHLHIYFELKNAKTFSKIKKEFPRGNIQVAKGSANDNHKYLSKQKLIREEGIPKTQGKRNDLDKIREVIKEKGKMREVINIATSYQSVKMAEQILKYQEPKRVWTTDFKIYWFHGETGAGKTREAYARANAEFDDDYYVCANTGRWWDGYDGHKCVIIDDFRANFCCFAELLKILQPYEYRVETKGGTRQLLATTFFITCPFPPNEVFSIREDINQLLRRITEIKMFSNNINAL